MDIKTQRMVDKYAGICICFILSLVHRIYRMLFRPRALVHPKRILVILLSEMGSLVLAYPMFNRIKQKYPDAEIYMLQFQKNKELTLLLDLVNPGNILTINDSSLWRFVLDSFMVFVRLRLKGINAVIDCELFARISSIFSLLSGAAIRVGFHPHTQEGLYRGGFINRPVMYNPYRHMSRQFVTLVDAMDSTTMPKAKEASSCQDWAVPAVRLDEKDLSFMEKRLKDQYGNQGFHCPDILIYPSGGILPIRAWPLGHYQELCKRLVHDGYTLGIIGPGSDKGLAETLLKQLSGHGCIDLTGFTRTIRELMVLYHMARLLITNDGGPGQFAALTPIETIIFFGPETPMLYGSMNDRATKFYTQFPCSPCITAYNHRHSACDGDNMCLKSISVDQVYDKAVALLQTNPRHTDEVSIQCGKR